MLTQLCSSGCQLAANLRSFANQKANRSVRVQYSGLVFSYTPAEPAYFEKRTLRRHAGALHLWALGVAAVISGDFFGWNFGLTAGGFGGMFLALTIMTIMYGGLCFSIAEMSPALPHTGGASRRGARDAEATVAVVNGTEKLYSQKLVFQALPPAPFSCGDNSDRAFIATQQIADPEP